jgi:hypothetical protein
LVHPRLDGVRRSEAGHEEVEGNRGDHDEQKYPDPSNNIANGHACHLNDIWSFAPNESPQSLNRQGTKRFRSLRDHLTFKNYFKQTATPLGDRVDLRLIAQALVRPSSFAGDYADCASDSKPARESGVTLHATAGGESISL